MSKKRKPGLGRGLGNLLDAVDDTEETRQRGEGDVIEIPLEKIRTNPDNPRKNFDKAAIEELAQTIDNFGLLQPVLVRKDGDGYMVISGERRLRACRFLKKNIVPCILKEISSQENLEIALIENIQREQLNAIEEAVVYKDLIEKYSLTQEKLSERVGKNRTTIANRVRLLQLPEMIQAAVADQRLTEGHVRPLLSVQNESLKLRLYDQILQRKLSAREVEELVRTQTGKKQGSGKKEGKGEKTTAEIKALQDELSEILKTRVSINHSRSGKGKLVIDYFDLDTCNQIVDIFRKYKNGL